MSWVFVCCSVAVPLLVLLLLAPRDAARHALLKLLVLLIYVTSHVYDYVSYPIYFIIYHPWRVRRYGRSNHARVERRDDCVIFHSLDVPIAVNDEFCDNGLDTIAKMYSYASTKYGSRDCLGTRAILAEEDERQPNGKVFKKLVLGDYQWRSFDDFHREASLAAAGMRKLNVRPKDKVAILAETRAEWTILANAVFQNNMTLVTLYTNLGNDGVIHGINETKVRYLICSHETLPKVKSVAAQIPLVQTIIIMEPASPGASLDLGGLERFNAVPFRELTRIGGFQGASEAPPPPPPATPDDTAIIMYTSGSTGNPKGVMVTHRNLVSSLSSMCTMAAGNRLRQNDRYIAFLPLAHVFEMIVEMICIMMGIKIGYSSAITLTNKSTAIKAGTKGDANVLRPTLLCSVPLILERTYKTIQDTMERQGWAAVELFDYFVRYKMKWQDRGFDTPLLNKTLFRKIRYFLGGRVRLSLSGGAPLSPETQSLTRTCMCMPVMQGYGLTETMACATVMSRYDRSTGRVGAPLMNVQIKLVNWEEGNYLVTDKPNPRGEIHIGGGNVAKGYYEMPEKTAEDFYEEDDRRWFKTGDIGEFDTDGVLKIIDRKKDLVKLQHGEYVSYGKAESVLKTCPIVKNICLFADPAKDFLVAIVIPEQDLLEEIAPEDMDPVEACRDPTVRQAVCRRIAVYGVKNRLEKFEVPGRVALVLDEWTPESGLVTAAFKLRRRFIVEKYQEHINEMYEM